MGPHTPADLAALRAAAPHRRCDDGAECAISVVADATAPTSLAGAAAAAGDCRPLRTAPLRSDSYSSVKEDLDGQPQSFVAAKERAPRERDESLFDIFPPRASASPIRAAAAGGPTLDALPAELLDLILTHLALDVPPTDFSPRNRDLVACLLTSRRMYAASRAVLYRRVTFPHGRVFSKFLRQVEANAELGPLAWRLDLSHFNSLGLGRTRAANGAAADFTRASFLRCLERLPNLKEVLLQHHVATDTDAAVLAKIFFGLPQLRALDLCSMDEPVFVDAFSRAMARLRASSSSSFPSSGPMQLRIQNLCLHECSMIPSADIATLLSRLPRLRILDLHHTQATDAALAAIPPSAALTHLNLGRCLQMTGPGVVHFVRSHPAVKTLVHLNLNCDLSRYRLLREPDVDALLPTLPATLRSLGLNGAALRPSHVPTLVRLTRHLEELSISYAGLSIPDVARLVGRRPADDDNDNDNNEDDDADADDDADRSAAAAKQPSALRYLDCTGLPALSQAALFAAAPALLGPRSQPLEVLEISEPLAASLAKATATNARWGWTVKEFGRRSWYVRSYAAPAAAAAAAASSASASASVSVSMPMSMPDPSRPWKLGSRWWGMRKVPVAEGDVGGFYGSKMFKS